MLSWWGIIVKIFKKNMNPFSFLFVLKTIHCIVMEYVNGVAPSTTYTRLAVGGVLCYFHTAKPGGI